MFGKPKMIKGGLVCWYIAEDAVISRDGKIVYWPNRANRFWRIKQMWAKLKYFLAK